MYTLISDFVNDVLLENVEGTELLGKALTESGVILFYVALVLFLVWVFKLFAGMLRW